MKLYLAICIFGTGTSIPFRNIGPHCLPAVAASMAVELFSNLNRNIRKMQLTVTEQTLRGCVGAFSGTSVSPTPPSVWWRAGFFAIKSGQCRKVCAGPVIVPRTKIRPNLYGKGAKLKSGSSLRFFMIVVFAHLCSSVVMYS
jgi:hypothetical protein